MSAVAAALAVSCSSGSTRSPSTQSDEEYRGSGNLDSPGAAERHGCCNGHGGACGCGHGKVQCCDGSFSRNCGCE
jgi:hypothetical protein